MDNSHSWYPIIIPKNNSSDSLLKQKSQEIEDRYNKAALKVHRLKYTFLCMLVLNVLLLVVVSICMVLIVPHLTNGDNPKANKAKQEHPDRIKCLMIQEKLHRLYRNGQMVDKVHTDDECSMGDLLDSVMQHMENSMQKDKSNRSLAFHLYSNNSRLDRCQDSKTLHCLKNWKLSMNTTKINLKDEIITVPSSGAYFLFSRVVIDAKLNINVPDMEVITHSIRYSNTGFNFNDLDTSSVKCGVMKNTMSHISYIEKIQYLEKDSQIKVALGYPRDMVMENSVGVGAFGMFKL